jgi:hypothetical protein
MFALSGQQLVERDRDAASTFTRQFAPKKIRCANTLQRHRKQWFGAPTACRLDRVCDDDQVLSWVYKVRRGEDERGFVGPVNVLGSPLKADLTDSFILIEIERRERDAR